MKQFLKSLGVIDIIALALQLGLAIISIINGHYIVALINITFFFMIGVLIYFSNQAIKYRGLYTTLLKTKLEVVCEALEEQVEAIEKASKKKKVVAKKKPTKVKRK